jgi:uncharacterized protein (DUF1330 family)
MSLYMIAAINVRDAEQYMLYRKGGSASLGIHGVEVLAAGVPKHVEGILPAKLSVILKFRDQEHFEKWYASPEYQTAVPIRQASADTPFIFTLEGVHPAVER